MIRLRLDHGYFGAGALDRLRPHNLTPDIGQIAHKPGDEIVVTFDAGADRPLWLALEPLDARFVFASDLPPLLTEPFCAVAELAPGQTEAEFAAAGDTLQRLKDAQIKPPPSLPIMPALLVCLPTPGAAADVTLKIAAVPVRIVFQLYGTDLPTGLTIIDASPAPQLTFGPATQVQTDWGETALEIGADMAVRLSLHAPPDLRLLGPDGEVLIDRLPVPAADSFAAVDGNPAERRAVVYVAL